MYFQYQNDTQDLISRFGYCESGGTEKNSCNSKFVMLISSHSQHTSRQGLVEQARAPYSVVSWWQSPDLL